MSESFNKVLRGTKRKTCRQGSALLAQIREMPDGFPFETIIKAETYGKGRTKYVFS